MLLGLLVHHSITAYVVREAQYLAVFLREVIPYHSFAGDVSARTS